MRPVLLTMNGFASFRDAAALDFRDVDYFALVGRTGAGKSTVIDALCFALYGTAPRWDHATSIKNALAPTANQATVSLVFDVGDHRYRVARQVRRASNQQVTQKEAILEQLADPKGLGGTEEEAGRTLSTDIRDVRTKVTQLLGLDFTEFCTCVVLPQGKFAEFLTADRARRRDILARFLGEHRYSQMRALAHQRSTRLDEQVNMLTGRIAQLPGHTDDDLAALAERHTTLTDLEQPLTLQTTALQACHQRIADLVQQLQRAEADLTRLQLSAPADVDTVEAEHQRATAAERGGDEAVEIAEAAQASAAAAATAGPGLRETEELLRAHQELSRLEELLPARRAEAQSATAAEEDADARAATAETSFDTAQADAQQARQQLERADAEVAAVQAGSDALRAVSVPATGDLPARVGAASRALGAAATKIEHAKAAVADLRARRQGLPDQSEVERLHRDWEEHASASQRRLELGPLADRARTELQQARTAHEQAQAAEHEAVQARDTAAVSDAAAQLRSVLEVGHACPVCEQPVTVVPATDHADHRHLGAAVTAAQQATHTAAENVSGAQEGAVRADERLAQLDKDLAVLDQRLAGSERAGVATQRQTGRDLAEQQRAAEEAEAAATAEHGQAAKARAELAETERSLGQTLRAALRQLLDAPEVDHDRPVEGWSELQTWLTERRQHHQDVLLPDAHRRQQTCHTAAAAAVAAEQRARQHRDSTRVAAGDASKHTVSAAHQLRQAEEQRQLLSEQVGDSDTAEATARLQQAQELDAASRQADLDLEAARRKQQAARHQLQTIEAELGEHRRDLAAARDTVVALGAPLPAGRSLRRDWDALVAWTDSRRSEVARDRDELRAAAGREHAQLSQDAFAMLRLLHAHDVTLGETAGLDADPAGVESLSAAAVETVPAQAGRALARATERAAQALQLAQESRDQQDQLNRERDDTRRKQQLADRLAHLLGNSQFLDWLTRSVLARLVHDASQTLNQLSGGQFSFTVADKTDVFIIDHHDADSVRSVLTLSGGETFQASLALAVALSQHMAALGAGGVSRLESIFLDEGFGTLDPDALAAVADSLENLAADGKQMVGVVTHVQQLAERIPHRFLIERDHRTSTITVAEATA